MDDDDWLDAAALAQIDALEQHHAASSQGSSQMQSPPPAPLPPAPGPPQAPDDLSAPLSHYFGFSALRGGQEEAIRGVLSGRDVCVYWPTGQGKSICYQLPALIARKVAVVVTPLVSLMVDQCAKLNHTVGSLPEFAGRRPAIFLGPHQTDHAAEERALSTVLLITPDFMLNSAGGFDLFADTLNEALTLLGVFVGLIFGLLLTAVLPGAEDTTGTRKTIVKLVSFPGKMFLNLLKMMVVPLISGSMIAGVCALQSAGANTGKLARVTFSFFAATTLIAVFIGLVVVNVIQPGL
jgi:hypothetical protein